MIHHLQIGAAQLIYLRPASNHSLPRELEALASAQAVSVLSAAVSQSKREGLAGPIRGTARSTRCTHLQQRERQQNEKSLKHFHNGPIELMSVFSEAAAPATRIECECESTEWS